MTRQLTLCCERATAELGLRLLRFPTRRPPDDETLIARAVNGDARAKRALAERLGPYIKARVLRATRGRPVGGHEVEDLLGEVWARLLADDGKLLRAWDASRATLPGYVNLITGQTVSKLRRDTSTQKRRPVGGTTSLSDAEAVASAAPAPDEHAADRARLEALWQHLEATLPPTGRLVLNMLYVDHRAPGDIARITGLSASTVHGWRFKIKNAAQAFDGGQGR